MITTKIAIPKKAFIDKITAQKAKVVRKKMTEIADAASDFAMTYIISHTKRQPSTGRLARAMKRAIRYDRKTFVVGVGDKARLPPYWYVVNYGTLFGSTRKYVPPASAGAFSGTGVPIKGGSGERFTEVQGQYYIKPGKPIEPMRYIEATKAYIKNRWKSRIRQK